MPFGRKESVGKRSEPGTLATVGRPVLPCMTGDVCPAKADGSVSVVRGSRIDLVRMIAADLIEQIRAADDGQRLALFMQLRKVQDFIAGLKHANAMVGAKTSKLAWVDVWTPAEV